MKDSQKKVGGLRQFFASRRTHVRMSTTFQPDQPRTVEGKFARKRHTAPAVALTLVGALAATGCVSEPAEPPTTPAPSSSGVPAIPNLDAESIAELEALEKGAEVTQEQARYIINSHDQLRYVYTMPDGTRLLVMRKETLPPQVQAVENAKAAAVDGGDGTGDNFGVLGVPGGVEAIAREASVGTGKKMLVIFTIRGYGDWDSGDEKPIPIYFLIAGGGDDLMQITREQRTLQGAIRRAEAFIATQEDPDLWGIAHP